MGRVIVAAFLLLAAPRAFADTLTGKVVKVADGDTVTILDNNTQHKIRLQGIDAPERKQPFGNASRKHLATLVAGQEITVKWENRDRYGRIVGFVIVRRTRCEPCAGQSTDGVVLALLLKGTESQEQEALCPSRRSGTV